ncbi:glycosyltransferase family 25 protein [Rhizobium sp. PAMB 3182]
MQAKEYMATPVGLDPLQARFLSRCRCSVNFDQPNGWGDKGEAMDQDCCCEVRSSPVIETAPIYVLTIDAADGPRRQHCTTMFNRLRMQFDFVQGVRSGDVFGMGIYSPWLNYLLSKRSLSAAEIAVYLGHRKIWKRVAEGGSDVALVVEDDLLISDTEAFGHVMRNASDHAAWDILKLFDFLPKKIVARHEWKGVTIVDYKYPASGCVAYLITRDAARRLLERKRIFRPVDEDFSWCWEFGLRVRSVSPNIVSEVSHTLGGSLLEDSRRNVRRRKNLLRSLVGMVIAGVKQLSARRHLARILRGR